MCAGAAALKLVQSGGMIPASVAGNQRRAQADREREERRDHQHQADQRRGAVLR